MPAFLRLISLGMLGLIALLLPAAADTTPAAKLYVEAIPGTMVSIDMIPVSAGTFTMGSPATEAGRKDDEGPQVQVQVAAYWMSKCEVTWDAYDLYWKEESLPEAGKPPAPQYEADTITRPTPPYSDETFGHPREGHPVLGITHHSAMMFCRWLSKKTGKLYRLPTEAEWEYACRAGSKTAYCYGDDPAALADYGWFRGNAEDKTHPIGTKKPNAWGFCDMHGSVAEWCLDHFAANDYASFPAGKLALRPVRVPTSTKFSHVVRGGSWADEAKDLRSAARRGSEKTWFKQDPQRPQSIWWMTDADFVGFRIVRAIDEQPELKTLLPRVNWQSKEFPDK